LASAVLPRMTMFIKRRKMAMIRIKGFILCLAFD
jgi:hypothetical protein